MSGLKVIDGTPTAISKYLRENQNNIKKCPKCNSKNISDGKSDFIYSIIEQREIPIQFCNDCYSEWFIEE